MVVGGGVALVAGAGPGIGAAVARRFAREGLTVALARRNGDKLKDLVESIEAAGGSCRSFGCDFRKEDQVIDLVANIEAEMGPIECAVHNIGANIGQVSVFDTTTRVYTKVWEMATLSAFLLGREVGKPMVERGRGSLIITGATASTRGASGHSAFSSAKMAKRALAQSLARELGPRGVHVAHVLVDGMVDNVNTRQFFAAKHPEIAAKFDEKEKEEGLVRPDQVAEVFLHLHQQHRSTWTQELDLRPWVEKW